MPGPFSTILRGVSRRSDTPLSIALVRGDPAYESAIFKTGQRFLVLPPVNGSTNRPPDAYPPNCHVLSTPVVFRPDMRFDLIVSCGRQIDWSPLAELARRSNCPLVCLEREAPSPHLTERQMMALRRLGGEHYVFGSHSAARAWGFDSGRDDVSIIYAPVDTDLFCGWTGSDGKVLTVVDGYTQRPEAGFDLWRAATRGLPVNPAGDTPGFSEAITSPQALASVYRGAAVFLNTQAWTITPVALMQAMAVGCPIVTRRSPIVEEFIEEGVNGYVTDDAAEMRVRLEELLTEQERARRLGEAAQHTALTLFSEAVFVRNWLNVIKNAVDRPACTWTEKYLETEPRLR